MKKLKYVKITMLFLLILCTFSILVINIRKVKIKNVQEKIEKIIERELELQLEQNDIKAKSENEIISPNGEIGFIIIPSIELKAPIKEGTSSEILKYAVGHFIETKLWNGNVVLASHNGGSYAHYFSRINELKNGEEIIYKTNMGERSYKVVENKIIEETNVNILKNTEENIITLVTCVKGKNNKRQCIIGKEINLRKE